MNILEQRTKYPHIKPYNLVVYECCPNRFYTGEVMSYPYNGSAMVRLVPGQPGTMIEMPLEKIRPRSAIKQILNTRIYLWNNLGCIGVAYDNFYADIFFKPYLGMYVLKEGVKSWYKLPSFRLLRRSV